MCDICSEESPSGKIMEGRIRSYSREVGYGFIHAKTGEDIFVSSYQLGRLDRRIRWGAAVLFTVGYRGERTLAENIEITDRYPNGRKVFLPNGGQIEIRLIEKVYYCSKEAALDILRIGRDALDENGWSTEQFGCLVIRCRKNESCIFVDNTCPIDTYPKTDLRGYYAYLRSFWEGSYGGMIPLRNMESNTTEERAPEHGKIKEGRIRNYSQAAGYGFIHAKTGENIFVSSYQLGGLGRRMRWGSAVLFTVGYREGKAVAVNVELTDRYPNGTEVFLPDGDQISIKLIEKVSYCRKKKSLDRLGIDDGILAENGWSTEQFDCIVIGCKKQEQYIFTDNICPIDTYPKTNLREYYAYLRSFWE